MISSRLRQLRLQRNQSVQEVARGAGVPALELRLAEAGEIRPTHALLLRLARYYGVSLTFLLTGREPAAGSRVLPLPDELVLLRSHLSGDGFAGKGGGTAAGEQYYRLRVLHQLTRAEMAAAIGASPGVVRALELGEILPNELLRRRYANYFGIPERILPLGRAVSPVDPADLEAEVAALLRYEEQLAAAVRRDA